MAVSKETLLSNFELQTKEVELDSICETVKIKKLTIAQREEVNEILFGESKMQSSSKRVEIEISRYNKASKLAVSYGLVEPKLSLNDINKLSDSASEFISEVFNAIQDFDEPKK